MATETPMRVMAPGGIQTVLGIGEGVRSSSSVHDNVAQELGVLLSSHSRIDNISNRRDTGPHRSGSAPPSFEGALALGGPLARDSSNGITKSGTHNDADVIDSEQELRSDPAYLAYYYSNVNRNPRLPPPIITGENYLLAQRLAISGLGDRRKPGIFDDNNGRSLFVAQQVLPTHNEEPESYEDEEPPMASLLKNVPNGQNRKVADGPPGFSSSHVENHQTNTVDLIPGIFSRGPSPMFARSRSSSCIPEKDAVSEMDPQYASLQDSAISARSVILTSSAVRPNPARSVTPNPVLSSRSVTSISDITHLLGSSSALSGNVSRTLKSGFSVGDGSVLRDISSLGLTGTKNGNVAHAGELAAALQGLNLTGVHGATSFEQHDMHTSVQMKQGTPSSTQHSHIQVGSQSPVQSQAFTQTLLHQQQQPQMQQFSGLDTNLRPPWRFAVPNPLQPGVANSAYAAAAAAAAMSCMAANPYYQNIPSYGPPYGVGGYPLNPALIPALMTSVTPSVTYDNPTAAAAAASTLAAQKTPVSGSDLHQFYRYASQAESSLPSYLQDPLYYQYFLQYSSPDSLELTRRYLSSIFGPGGNKPDLSQNGKSDPLYCGNHGFPMPLPSLISSPVLPGSPMDSGSFSQQTEQGYRLATSGSKTDSGSNHMGWHGVKTMGSEESKKSSLLEDLKSNKTRRFEIADILGHVVEFSVDQHGSRLIQQKLETVSLEEKISVFKEMLPHAVSLMTDVFGNYVVQKFFEHGTPEQRSELANHLVGNVLNLSLQMYGCRVIQKSLEMVQLEEQIRIVSELDGHVMQCVRDQNGNHVIQKCIECVPPEHIDFIISSFCGQVVMLSTHPYGCRVIQRVLEHRIDDQKQQSIMEEILSSVCTLAQDQYGNYVVQHILEHGKQCEKSEILRKLAGQIVQMSQHKFASNVVEKCLEFGGRMERQVLITEMLGDTDENEPLQAMMKDQYANYVVQKVLEICDEQQRELLLSRIRVHLHALKRYTYGKHIVAWVEKLVAAGERHSSQVS